MSFQYPAVTDNYILARCIQPPCVLITTGFDYNSIVSLVKRTVFDQKVTTHFKVNTIIIVSMCPHIQITDDTSVTHIEVNGPKRTLTYFKSIQHHILTAIEMYQMRTQMIFTGSHLAFYNRYIGRSFGIQFLQSLQMGCRTFKPYFPCSHLRL